MFLFKKNEKVQIGFLTDEIDVNVYLFPKFFDDCNVQNRVT